MQNVRLSMYLVCLLGLAGCNLDKTNPPDIALDTVTPWNLSELSELRKASCPPGSVKEEPEPITVIAKDIMPEVGDTHDKLNGLALSGVWEIDIDHKFFGGLSSLSVLDDGTLFTLSDQGGMVWINIDQETRAPNGTGAMARLRGYDGRFLDGKLEADSEGLALYDGLAFVSFERDHRISVFDLENCGPAAREIVLTRLPSEIMGTTISENRGPEALSFTAGGNTLTIGQETRTDEGAIMLSIPLGDATMARVQILPVPDAYAMTGMDYLKGMTAKIFRSYSPIFGVCNMLVLHEDEDIIATAWIDGEIPTDNAEGVALERISETRWRAWVISDDNYRASQRTLLWAFEFDPTERGAPIEIRKL